jgi:hypothetical protein
MGRPTNLSRTLPKNPHAVEQIQAHIAKSENVGLASCASCVYRMVTAERRWVETKISAPRLGTRGGGSQWCNRLPEVVTASVANFAF